MLLVITQACYICTCVLGGGGYSGLWHGHRQARRQVCHPSHHQQVHWELLPGERPCRSADIVIRAIVTTEVPAACRHDLFSVSIQVEMTVQQTASSTLVSPIYSGSAPWWSWRMLVSRSWGRWLTTARTLTGSQLTHTSMLFLVLVASLLFIYMVSEFCTLWFRHLLSLVFAVWRCRRSLMAAHFDEVWDDEDCNQMCDTCRHRKGVFVLCCFACLMFKWSLYGLVWAEYFYWCENPSPLNLMNVSLSSLFSSDFTTVDVTEHARQVVQIMELAASMDEKLTPLKLVEAWMGKGPAKRRKMIQATSLSQPQAEAVIVWLLLKEYLRYRGLFCCKCNLDLIRTEQDNDMMAISH